MVGILTEEDTYPLCLQDRQLDLEEFIKVVMSLNTKGQLDNENPYQIFEANRIIFSNQQALKEEDKRITLESLLAVIFKYDLITV